MRSETFARDTIGRVARVMQDEDLALRRGRVRDLIGLIIEATGLQVLYDERDAGPGEKFADAELLGCPVRLTVGRRTLGSGEIEVQVRRGRESRAVSIAGAAQAVAELWHDLP